ncbi:MAG: hypothetical protein ABFC84_12405 [Veillonellales bacterium]
MRIALSPLFAYSGLPQAALLFDRDAASKKFLSFAFRVLCR